MTRGRPLLVGGVAGGGLVGLGLVIALDLTTVPPILGASLVLVGVLVLVVGARTQQISPPEPTLNDGETEVARYTPTQKPALATLSLGAGALGLAGGLYFGTSLPLIYPILAGAVGIYLVTSGGARYYKNCLTTYYLTDQRAISEYRFVRLQRAKVNLEDAEGGTRTDSQLERFVGAGSITVTAPSLSVTFRSVPDPDEIDAEIERLIHEKRRTAPAIEA